MKNKIKKFKHVKPIPQLWKFYLQVITDACVNIAVLEICSEKMTRKSVVRSFKNTVAVAVQCRYINDAFAGFCQQIFEKKCFEGYLRKNLQKIFVTLSKFWPLKGSVVWSWVNPLKKKNLQWKSFSGNVEWSSKKLWKMISTDIKTDVK